MRALRDMEFAAEDGGTEVMPAGEAVDHADVSDLKPWEHSGPNIRHATGGWERFVLRCEGEGVRPVLCRWRGRIRFLVCGVDVGAEGLG